MFWYTGGFPFVGRTGIQLSKGNLQEDQFKHEENHQYL